MMAILIVALLAVGAIFAACGGGDDDTSVDLPGGGEVNVGDDLPDDFPDDFPLPDGADVQSSYSGEQGGVSGSVVSFNVDGSVDDVSSFYEDELGGDGPWTSEANGDIGGSTFYNATHEDGDRVAYVLITESDGNTNLLVTIGEGDDIVPGDDDDPTQDDASDDDEPTADSGDDDDDQPAAELPPEENLPDDFPQDEVPLPDDARVTSATSLSSGGVDTFLLEFYSEDSIDDLKSHFKSELEGNGWTEALTSTSNGEVFATYTKGESSQDNVIVTIAASDVDGYNRVSLSVSATE
jgi:hypothetical protein